MVERRTKSPSPADIKKTVEKIYQKQEAKKAKKKQQDEERRKQEQGREAKRQQEQQRDQDEMKRLSLLLEGDGVDKYSSEGVPMMMRKFWLDFKLNPQEKILHEIGDFQDILAEKNPQLYNDYTRQSIDGFNRQTNQFIEIRRMTLPDDIYQRAIQGLRAGKN